MSATTAPSAAAAAAEAPSQPAGHEPARYELYLSPACVRRLEACARRHDVAPAAYLVALLEQVLDPDPRSPTSIEPFTRRSHHA